jgi:fucose 4-O-acetylase-like acetyltransferase
MTRMTTTSSSIDLAERDLTLDLARVFCVLLVVVIHLLYVGVGRDAAGGLVVTRPLDHQAWFPAATWAGQIMPLFFVVGGFASLTAWRGVKRRGGTASDYVRNRVLRLAQPALPLFVFYVVVLGVAALLAIDPAPSRWMPCATRPASSRSASSTCCSSGCSSSSWASGTRTAGSAVGRGGNSC